MEIIISDAAAQEIEDAALWYRAISLKLEDELIRELDYGFEYIAYYPDGFKAIYKNVRGIILPKYPYTLYYRIVDEYIEVISFFHHKRNPKIWKRRTKK